MPIRKLYRESPKALRNLRKSRIFTCERFIPDTGQSIQEIKQVVLDLQMKMAVAIRNKDFVLANKLSNTIIRSKEARTLAVYRVLRNKGARSPGFSEQRPTTNQEYLALTQQLWQIVKNPNNYKASPLVRSLIPKPKGGFRPISVPTYLDRSLQQLYKFTLDVVAEEIQSPYSFGFRPFRSPGWATKSLILATFPKKYPPKYALELDIAKCYDTMDHNWMLSNICSIALDPSCEPIHVIPKHILNQWLKCGFIYIDNIAKGNLEILPTSGIPQGGPISPTISNIVLNGIEQVIKSIETVDSPIWLARFADDITLLFDDLSQKNIVMEKVDEFLAPRGMKLNPDKCYLRNLKSEPFTFVGFDHHVVKNRKALPIDEKGNTKSRRKKFMLINIPPPKKVEAIKKKLLKILNPLRSTEAVFRKINPILRGWLNYYACANSSDCFGSLGWWLWHQIFKFFWYKYKPQRYFRVKSRILRKKLGLHITKTHLKRMGRSLIDHTTPRKFFWWYVPKEQTIKKVSDYFLVAPELTPIDQPSIIMFRDKKLPGQIHRDGLNAYHPGDRFKLSSKALGWKSGDWKKALEKTKGGCALCNITLLDLSSEEILELHHIKPIQFGGPRTIPNLKPLCKECHQEVTNAILTKNLSKIVEYENMKILEGVSSAFKLLNSNVDK